MKVIQASDKDAPRSAQEAMQLAKQTGVLCVPAGVMRLTIDSGVKIEVRNGCRCSGST